MRPFAAAALAWVALFQPLAAQGPRLVVLNKADATLVTVDPASGKILGTVATGEAPHEVAISADGRTAFVANYGSQTPGSTISVVDLTAMKEVRRVDVSPLRRPHGVAVADGKLYYTSETNRVVARLDPAVPDVLESACSNAGVVVLDASTILPEGQEGDPEQVASLLRTLLERAAGS